MKFYLDTSVFGGYFDSEFRNDTIRLFEEMKKGTFSVILTNLTAEELVRAPDDVRDLVKEIRPRPEVYEIDEEMVNLAKLYITKAL